MKKILILLLIFTLGFAKMPVVKKGFDFRNYKKIVVTSFVSNSIYNESGAVVSDEFIRQLKMRGNNVVDIVTSPKNTRNSYRIMALEYEADSILTGAVIRYIPDGKETIYFKNEEGKIVSKVFLREAQIGISAEFIDGKTGEVVWFDSYYYTGFEITDTINKVVDIIISRLQKGGRS